MGAADINLYAVLSVPIRFTMYRQRARLHQKDNGIRSMQ